MQPTLFTELRAGDAPSGRRQTRPTPALEGADRVTGSPNRHPAHFQSTLELNFTVDRLPPLRVQNAMWAALNARRRTPPYLNASEAALFERLDAARCARLARLQ